MYPSRVARAYCCSFALWGATSSAFLHPRFSQNIYKTTRIQMSTTTTADNVATNFQNVQELVTVAAKGRCVRLVAVSKTKPVPLLQAAYTAGCRTFGENYVQEVVEKAPQLPDNVHWHFIGTLQSNKASMLVKAVQPVSRLTVETVGSIKLANKLEKAVLDTDNNNNKLVVFVQVNTSGEDSKGGVEPGDACISICRHILQNCPHLVLQGLMTIGAVGDVSCFDVLKHCQKQVQKALSLDALELSMGMSGDFEQAIAAGSTNVRVGSTIFGERYYPNKA